MLKSISLKVTLSFFFSGYPDLRCMETVWPPQAPCDRLRHQPGLCQIPLPPVPETECRSLIHPRMDHWRAW